MKAVKVMVNKGGTGFRPLTKSTPPAVTRPRQMQRPQDKTVEPAPMQVETIAPVISQKKPRVCCYCRVSTLLDSQETSIEGQREHYESLIKGNPEWEFAGIYLEAGVSGTKAEIRPELQRLIADCKAGKIDLILTKSISRFARNTSDCLEMVRLLTSLGVAIHFEKEQIHTDDMHSEFMLSILACLAEDESHSISGNMKWSIRKRFENGTYQQPVAPYGYEWEEGKLVIVAEEAEVVREIFAMSLRGLGCRNIARELNNKKIPTARGRKWSQVTIMEMMKNPVYIGDALYQKSYMDETFRQRKNKGELDQFYDQDHHEAIISREDFEKAQAVMGQRAKEVGYNGEEQKRSSNRYCFTGILFCKACGSVMHRQPRGKNSVTWVCHKHAMHPDLCRMKPQSDDDLKRAFINCLNKMAWSQARGEGVLDVYETMLGKTEAEKNAERLVEIEKELEENRNETNKLNAIVMRERYLPEHREKKLFLTKQAQDLMAEKNRILIAGAPSGTLQQLKTFIGGWKITDDPAAFPEETFTEFVERCIVLPGKMVTFEFRCGLKLTESLYQSILEDGR